MDSSAIDVVVGAGLAGLRCATSLAESGSRVVIVEADENVGGRIAGAAWPEVSSSYINKGAARYLACHEKVGELVKSFSLPVQPEFHASVEAQCYFLRGRRSWRYEPRRLASSYSLSPSEAGLDPDKILHAAAIDATRALDVSIPETEHEWNTLFAGPSPLHEVGFWDLLRPFLSLEAYLLLRDCNGYDLENWRASEVLRAQLVDFGKDPPDSFSLEGGTVRLAEKMTERLTGELHVQVLTGSRVTSVELAGLTEPVRLHHLHGKLVARSVTLAIPPSALEGIDGISAIKNAIRPLTNRIEGLPTLRVVFGYSQPWWVATGLPALGGKCMTDLPIRQITFPSLPPGTRGSYSALALTINDPRSYAVFRTAFPLNFQGWWTDCPIAMRRTFTEMSRQVTEAIGAEAPTPLWVLSADWGSGNHEAGYHGRRPAYTNGHDEQAVVHSLLGRPIFLANAAYSDKPTWMEGALESADAAMMEFLSR